MVSVVIGAGLVSVPHVMYEQSLGFAIPFYFFMLSCAMFSIHIFLVLNRVTGKTSI